MPRRTLFALVLASASSCGNAETPPARNAPEVTPSAPTFPSIADTGRAAIRIAGFVAPEELPVHRVEVFVGRTKAYSSDLPDEHEQVGTFDFRGEAQTIGVSLTYSDPAISNGDPVFVVLASQWRLDAATASEAAARGGIDIKIALRRGGAEISRRLDLTLWMGSREIAAVGAPKLEAASIEDVLGRDPNVPPPSTATVLGSKEARDARASLFETITRRDVVAAHRTAARTRGRADNRRCLEQAVSALDAIIAATADRIDGLARALEKDDRDLVQHHLSELELMRLRAQDFIYQGRACVQLHSD